MTVLTEMDRDYLNECYDERDDDMAELRSAAQAESRRLNHFCYECRTRGSHAPGCLEEPQDDEESDDEDL